MEDNGSTRLEDCLDRIKNFDEGQGTRLLVAFTGIPDPIKREDVIMFAEALAAEGKVTVR